MSESLGALFGGPQYAIAEKTAKSIDDQHKQQQLAKEQADQKKLEDDLKARREKEEKDAADVVARAINRPKGPVKRSTILTSPLGIASSPSAAPLKKALGQ